MKFDGFHTKDHFPRDGKAYVYNVYYNYLYLINARHIAIQMKFKSQDNCYTNMRGAIL